MSKRTYEEYIKNGCHPVGYNEPCQSYYFGQVSVDLLLDQIDQLKQQLAEKDKEIERLKNLFELNNEVVINQGKEIFDLRVQVLQQKQNQTQLAIQELEKVKELVKDKSAWQSPFGLLKIQENDVEQIIDQQIKELKGE